MNNGDIRSDNSHLNLYNSFVYGGADDAGLDVMMMMMMMMMMTFMWFLHTEACDLSAVRHVCSYIDTLAYVEP